MKVDNENIVIQGGNYLEGTDIFLNDMQILHLPTNTWTEIPHEFRLARGNHTVVESTSDKHYYIFGGEHSMTRYNNLYTLEIQYCF